MENNGNSNYVKFIAAAIPSPNSQTNTANVLLEFDYELKYTDDEHTDYDFVCNVLSSGMVLAWIEPQVKSMNNIHQIYGGKEEKFYAQANHLSELNKLQEQCEIALSRLINSRAYINNSYLNEE